MVTYLKIIGWGWYYLSTIHEKRDKLLAKRYRLAFAKFQRGCLWLGDC